MTTSTQDPYEILGVERNVSVAELKMAWRHKAQALHPDKNPDNPDCAIEFANARKAYLLLKTLTTITQNSIPNVLNDVPAYEQENEFAAYEPEPALDVGVDVLPRHNPWQTLTGETKPGKNLETTVYLSKTQAATGGSRLVRLTYSVTCKTCYTSGLVPSGNLCPSCRGYGRHGPNTPACSTCNGSGQGYKTCETCLGSGWEDVSVATNVSWPQNIKNETIVKLPRAGAPGVGGGPPGNLTIVYKIL